CADHAQGACVHVDYWNANEDGCIGLENDRIAKETIGFRSGVCDGISVFVVERVDIISAGFQILEPEVAVIISDGEVFGLVGEDVESIGMGIQGYGRSLQRSVFE